MWWCTVSVLFCLALAFFAKIVANKLVTSILEMSHINEFIGNFVSAVFVMELGILESMYGKKSAPFIIAFLVHLIIKFIFFMNVKAYGSLLTFLEIFYTNRKKVTFSVFLLLSIMLVQFAGIFTGQWVTKLIWVYEDHVHVHGAHAECVSTLSSSHAWYKALLFEAVGVFIFNCVDWMTPEKVKALVRSLVILLLFEGLGFATGMWMHPGFATAFTFRCMGHSSDWEHVMVYWLGPVIGFICSWETRLIVQGIISGEKEKQKSQ